MGTWCRDVVVVMVDLNCSCLLHTHIAREQEVANCRVAPEDFTLELMLGAEKSSETSMRLDSELVCSELVWLHLPFILA